MHGSVTERDDQPAGEDGPRPITIFECGHCGASRFQRVISYDRFGFPICPVCNRTNRPEPVAME